MKNQASVDEQRTCHPDRKAECHPQDIEQVIPRKNLNAWLADHEARLDRSTFLLTPQTWARPVNDDQGATRTHQSFLEKRQESSWILMTKEEGWSAATEIPSVMANQSQQAVSSTLSTNWMLLAYMGQVVSGIPPGWVVCMLMMMIQSFIMMDPSMLATHLAIAEALALHLCRPFPKILRTCPWVALAPIMRN
jgi:hypothetical protein